MAGWVTQVGAWTTGWSGAHGRVPSVTLDAYNVIICQKYYRVHTLSLRNDNDLKMFSKLPRKK